MGEAAIENELFEVIFDLQASALMLVRAIDGLWNENGLRAIDDRVTDLLESLGEYQNKREGN